MGAAPKTEIPSGVDDGSFGPRMKLCNADVALSDFMPINELTSSFKYSLISCGLS
jgi:hypothetical protein